MNYFEIQNRPDSQAYMSLPYPSTITIDYLLYLDMITPVHSFEFSVLFDG